MENGVAVDMACEREFCIHFRGVYILLFLFCGVVRYPFALSANRKPTERFIARNTLHMGVESLESVEVFDNAMYNLQGQRILAPAKGQIYIQHGRKMFAR